MTGGIDTPRLLIHLPGFTEETVHASPLLELYAAGVRYRKALPTLVTEAAAGRVRPEQIAAFLEQGELTLDAADAWLAAILDDREGGLSAQLRAMSLPAVIDDLLTGGFVAGQVKSPDWSGCSLGSPDRRHGACRPPGETPACLSARHGRRTLRSRQPVGRCASSTWTTCGATQWTLACKESANCRVRWWMPAGNWLATCATGSPASTSARPTKRRRG